MRNADRIELRGVQKRFGDVAVLRDIDLKIAAGEFCVFVGPSGCGKSTLLRLIAGLDDPSGGDILIDGARVNDVPPAQRDVAMVFQSYALYPHMTAYENMAFGLRHRRLPPGEIERRVEEAAQMLHLEDLLQRRPRELSGGQRQRVAIGRAIVRRPKAFLFDEPLSNLDAALRVRMRVEISRLHREHESASMVYVTHDQVEAMTLAQRIVLLRPDVGRSGEPSIAQAGAPLELYHHPANRFVAGFIGSPAMNFLDGTVAEAGPEHVRARTGQLMCVAAVDGQGLGRDEVVTLGIRPEHLRLGEGEHIATLEHVEHLGEHGYAHLKLDGVPATLIAKTEREDLRVGERLPVGLPPECMHVFRGDGSALPRQARFFDKTHFHT
jgi:multiple sugar transport system ATP-binding protein